MVNIDWIKNNKQNNIENFTFVSLLFIFFLIIFALLTKIQYAICLFLIFIFIILTLYIFYSMTDGMEFKFFPYNCDYTERTINNALIKNNIQYTISKGEWAFELGSAMDYKIIFNLDKLGIRVKLKPNIHAFRNSTYVYIIPDDSFAKNNVHKVRKIIDQSFHDAYLIP